MVEFKSFFIFITREGNYIVPGKAQVFLRFHLPPELEQAVANVCSIVFCVSFVCVLNPGFLDSLNGEKLTMRLSSLSSG